MCIGSANLFSVETPYFCFSDQELVKFSCTKSQGGFQHLGKAVELEAHILETVIGNAQRAFV